MKKYAVISMDVEDWYHTYFPKDNVDRSISLLDGLDVALNIMNQKRISGSFFVVGEIAEQLSEKLRAMESSGHDIALHNWQHIRPTDMTLQDYREQLIRSKEVLERILGHSVAGYRAPSFGIDDERFAIVNSLFKYDSSMIKPQKSAKYGQIHMNGFTEIFPTIYKCNQFVEFEVSTQNIGGVNLLLGGGYIRMLPWFFMKRMIYKYLKTGKTYIMYIHPIDLSAKSIPNVKHMGLGRYLRTHIGRKNMAQRFETVIQMLEDDGYEFVTFEQLRKLVLSNG